MARLKTLEDLMKQGLNGSEKTVGSKKEQVSIS
jgi:hypothetical protein